MFREKVTPGGRGKRTVRVGVYCRSFPRFCSGAFWVGKNPQNQLDPEMGAVNVSRNHLKHQTSQRGAREETFERMATRSIPTTCSLALLPLKASLIAGLQKKKEIWKEIRRGNDPGGSVKPVIIANVPGDELMGGWRRFSPTFPKCKTNHKCSLTGIEMIILAPVQPDLS